MSEDQHGDRDTGDRGTTGDRDRDVPPPMTPADERGHQRIHRRPPRRGLGAQAAGHDLPHPAGDAAVGRRRRQPALGDRGRTRGEIIGEWSHAAERLVERRAERPLIRARIGLARRQLLWCHVRGRPQERAGPRQRERWGEHQGGRGDHRFPWHGRGVAELRQAEAGDAGSVVEADQDVVGLDVAVHDPRRMCSREAAAGFEQAIDDLAGLARCALEPRAQAAAVDQLHRDEGVAAMRADVEHGHDVRVREPRERARLAHQVLAPIATDAAVAVCAQQLQRDAPM